jgi:hypothetical protein
MAFALPLTLAETRRAVAIRLNFGPQADSSPDMRLLLDEFVRRAARELLLEADWVELMVEFRIPLTVAQHRYDFPDNMDLGRIQFIAVLDDQGREYPLEPRLQSFERTEWDSRGEVERARLPLKYEVTNEELVIYPAPDARYPELLVRGYSTPAPPQHNDDRVPVDAEALIQKATAIGKKHFGAPDAQQADLDLAIYLSRLRPTESDAGGFRIGGPFSRRGGYHRRHSSARRGQDGWWEGWTPSP